jgi:hypothetical protein
MKAAVISALLAAALASGAQAAELGVSIGFSQPGVYGRVDIGPLPQVALVAPQPVLIAPPPAVIAPAPTFGPPLPAIMRPAPVYMWVPTAHRLHWARYCGVYDACRSPVYFVRDDWYAARIRHGHGRPEWRGDFHGHRPGWHAGWRGERD